MRGFLLAVTKEWKEIQNIDYETELFFPMKNKKATYKPLHLSGSSEGHWEEVCMQVQGPHCLIINQNMKIAKNIYDIYINPENYPFFYGLSFGENES